MIIFRFRDRRRSHRVRPPAGRIAKARTLRDFPGDDWWQALHRIADAEVPGVREAFLAALQELLDATDFEAVARALEAKDIGAVMEAIPWEQFEQALAPLRETLERIWIAGAEVSRASTAAQLLLELPFQVPPRRAIEWARAHVGELIVDISHQTRMAIRDVIVQQLQAGVHPSQSIRTIRSMIGLTRRQARAVANLQAELLADGVGLPEVARQVERYRRRLIADRAENIARTETMQAANAGHRGLWEAAVDEGLINGGEWEREWVAVVPDPDERTCELCEALDGQRAPIGGTYPDGTLGPTKHPRCRCVERLVRSEGAQTVAPGAPLERPGSTPAVIGSIPDSIELPEWATSREVRLTQEQFDHIIRRRGPSSADLDFVLRRVEQVLQAPSHFGWSPNQPRRLSLFRWFPADQKGVLVGLKVLPGEVWLATAYPMGRSTLRQAIRAGKLRVIGKRA